MGRLDGKVAIVTGGAAGIGAGTAERLGQEGAKGVIADRNIAGAEQVAHGISNGQALAVQFDATDEGSIQKLIATAKDHFGRIDILHNNVAMTAEAWSRDTNLLDTTVETLDLSYAINLRSMFIACKAALPIMIDQGGGSIINMSSGSGEAGAPTLIAYGTTKGGVITLTKYLAVQYGRANVRSNCILPGLIMTEQIKQNVPDADRIYRRTTPFDRAGTPADIAGMVVFFASDDAVFVNGQIVHCDGGGSAGAAEPLDF
ncbi:MAG: short-chain dehydrogenase [Sphingobium sp.]|nr:short-chain dehydrogenase [Sphingobium sp.]